MKTGFWLLFALLIGMVLGGLGPKADLRQAREELAQFKKQKPHRTSDGLAGITSMLRIPDAEPPTETRRHRPPPSVSLSVNQAPGGLTPSVTTSNVPDDRRVGEAPATGAGRATLQTRIEQAADLWKVRVDLARNGFVANVATAPELAAQFDAVIADMNSRLGADIRTWVDYLKTQPQATPETGIRMMSTLSTDLVQTYEDLDATMPAGWREQAGESFQVFDFIDPQVALPLTEVEQALHFGSRPPTEDAAHDTDFE